MKIVFLDASTLGNDIDVKKLQDFGELELHDTTHKSQVNERIENADIIITNKVVIDKNAMDSAKRLKLICVAATGMNNIDLETAKQKNIAVKNVSGYSTDSVAQLTFSLILYLINHPKYYDNYVQSGEYTRSSIFTHIGRKFWELSGKQMGIIGLGTIGKRVARLAEAFGMNVVYYSTSGKNNTPDFKRVDLNELLTSSDIVSIHAPLNENTKNLIGISELKKMPKHAIIINTGRGGIINEHALAQAIDEEIIGGAGIDVLTAEPIDINNPLMMVRKSNRLIITPHIAWTSIEARQRLLEGIYENIKHFISFKNL